MVVAYAPLLPLMEGMRALQVPLLGALAVAAVFMLLIAGDRTIGIRRSGIYLSLAIGVWLSVRKRATVRGGAARQPMKRFVRSP